MKRVLLVAYGYCKNDVSESLTAYKISKELEKYCEIKIITKDQSILPNIITIKTTNFLKHSAHYRAIKPDYPEFILKAYRYAKKHQNEFDVFHHISPISLRYPNPLCNLNKPFIWGPVGGSINYPKGFKEIQKRESNIQKLRNLDIFRLKYDPLMINTLKKSTKIIVPCSSVLRNLPKKYHKKITIIPEGIDNDSEFCVDNFTKKYIFSSGRLVPYKGFELLIKAFKKANLPKDIKLLITGNGGEKKRLSKLIHGVNMTDRVQLIGKVSKKDNLSYMRNSLFCVFPALNEAFGHVNLEAMSMGKAIIVTDNGGPADIVINSKTGFKILSNSIEGYITKLSEKINILYQNDTIRNEMSINAYQRFRTTYSWDVIGKKYYTLYKDFLNEIE